MLYGEGGLEGAIGPRGGEEAEVHGKLTEGQGGACLSLKTFLR